MLKSISTYRCCCGRLPPIMIIIIVAFIFFSTFKPYIFIYKCIYVCGWIEGERKKKKSNVTATASQQHTNHKSFQINLFTKSSLAIGEKNRQFCAHFFLSSFTCLHLYAFRAQTFFMIATKRPFQCHNLSGIG